MKNKIVYISGAITSDHNYKEKFDKYEKLLKDKGFIVINPTCLPDGLEYEQYMSIDFAMINVCDIFIMLPSWVCSLGSKRELEHAKRIGKYIIKVEKLLNR